MPNPTHLKNQVVVKKRELINYMKAGCKKKADWRIGTEHEKFAFNLKNFSSLTYQGENGIQELLQRMMRFGWEPIFENGNIIGLSSHDGCSISLEPAGQVELSGAPLKDIHQTCDEVQKHLQQVKSIAKEMNIGFLGLGHQPKWSVDDSPWMPKERYKIMRSYMPKKGSRGIDMMVNTCTVQVNLDFDTEKTMTQMFRIGIALQPIATALWANSPFYQGKPSGYLSYRSHIWSDTDPDRCGMLPLVFKKDFGFERYVDYALNVPMYFVVRNGRYIDVSGDSFLAFMSGGLKKLPGERPRFSDWETHLSTIFTEVRLKTFLEMRGADGGPWNRLCGLPAFWVGLLYDTDARESAWNLVKNWTINDMVELRSKVPVKALNTSFRGKRLIELAEQVLLISHQGLKNRCSNDSVGMDETHFLN
ncbi:MAG: glutamate--cysteine ligase, partial [Magnetovibrio sp.]|nr:glutamate--cysteine ligase [Magnetovibrio sp.]